MQDYQWIPLTKNILAFSPVEMPENGHDPKPFCICFESQTGK
jgi:hypothetical protein